MANKGIGAAPCVASAQHGSGNRTEHVLITQMTPLCGYRTRWEKVDLKKKSEIVEEKQYSSDGANIWESSRGTFVSDVTFTDFAVYNDKHDANNVSRGREVSECAHKLRCKDVSSRHPLIFNTRLFLNSGLRCSAGVSPGVTGRRQGETPWTRPYVAYLTVNSINLLQSF